MVGIRRVFQNTPCFENPGFGGNTNGYPLGSFVLGEKESLPAGPTLSANFYIQQS